jgi:hypothetical protein
MALGVVNNLTAWNFQNSYVERMADNTAYTAAHPDDTLCMAGPARKQNVQQGGAANLLPIGFLQAFSITSSKPTQPMMMIGSGRSLYVSGKSQTAWNCGRLFVNGRNLLRVLYHNAILGGIDLSLFDDPATDATNPQFVINLDSEIFLVPFGLGVIFRDKTHGYVGGGYLELCMITSYAIGWNAGQSLILENVSGMSDRVLPFGALSPAGIQPNGNDLLIATELDAILGFTDNVSTEDGNVPGTVITSGDNPDIPPVVPVATPLGQ